MTKTDYIYQCFIQEILHHGEVITSRNGTVKRCFELPTITFDSTPLVTVRKTAWKKALREMEWFLSPSNICPIELLDWWQEQLSPKNRYIGGYSDQLRFFSTADEVFDQIEHLIQGIKHHPFSRRHVITTWNPADMHRITQINSNDKTPTTCHNTITQFFVSENHYLSLKTYQRSADMLLGVPHNWIQTWALLLWIANRTDTIPHKMLWTFGDAHIYLEPSHLEVAESISNLGLGVLDYSPRLYFDSASIINTFAASDFIMAGAVPEPIITTRPKLL